MRQDFVKGKPVKEEIGQQDQRGGGIDRHLGCDNQQDDRKDRPKADQDVLDMAALVF